MLMNRFRRLYGPNSYQSELGVDPLALIPHGGRWLDVGCGTGVAVREAARLRTDITVVALDLEAGFVDGRPLPPNLAFVQGDLGRLPLGGAFELVTGVHVLHFVPDQQAVLRALAGRLAPGGRLRANLDPNDIWLGSSWATARPLGGAPGVVEAAPAWGVFIAHRADRGGNRQGVESRQSLYAPER
jgi:SAM-dependent methyltransferase